MMNSKSLVYTVLIYKVLHKPKHYKLTAVAAKEADRESGKQICGLKNLTHCCRQEQLKSVPLKQSFRFSPLLPTELSVLSLAS